MLNQAGGSKWRQYLKKDKSKFKLPIDDHQQTILYLLERNNILLVAAETGSGKSTRLPQILYSAGIYNKSESASSDFVTTATVGAGADSTSSAKTPTSIPSSAIKSICICQPRRIAAIQLAQRVADELGCQLGTTVGYVVRFSSQLNEDGQTPIKFLTEGLLLREMMYDPLLNSYSVIILDEVHERNLNTDLLLGLLKCLLLKRPDDLKLIICSATLNVEQILSFLTIKRPDGSPPGKKPEVLSIPSKVFPVKIYYRDQAVANYLEAAIETVIDINETNLLAPGKILLFLTGQDEVDYACERLNEYADANSSRLDIKSILALPLHASLKADEISRVFEEYGRNTRLCVVATNVAETSLTINEIAFVVDSGFVKIKVFDNKSGADTLCRVPISKSSARQRAGRAGRTREGKVYRLYSEEEFDRLEEDKIPEIQRSSLTELVMMMLSLGIRNLQRFPLISPMPRDNLASAMDLLYALQIIDDTGQLTSIGQKASLLNLEPRLAKILVSPASAFCSQEACKIVAMLQVKEIYFKPSSKHASDLWSNKSLTGICASEGDLPSYLNIFNGFISNNKSQKWADKRNLNHQALLNAVEICSKLEAQLKSRCNIELRSCDARIDLIRQSLLSGLFVNAAYLHPNGDYKTIGADQTVYVHPSSIFSEMLDKPKYVVFVEILNTTKPFMRHMMAIESEWLLNVAPHFYSFSTGLPSTTATTMTSSKGYN